jgi:hypothetical protein
MEKFDVHILGCGSAMPTLKHWPSAQVVNIREKLFLIDCGEGAQAQFRQARQKFSRLSHIFISHLPTLAAFAICAACNAVECKVSIALAKLSCPKVAS